MSTRIKFPILTLALAALLPVAGAAQAGSFSYQGKLSNSGEGVDGTYDLELALFTGVDSGVQVGPTLCLEDVAVTGGRFTVDLDFGAGVFNGDTRFLGVFVREDADQSRACGDTEGFTALAPRQMVAAAPVARRAIAASRADVAATAGDAQTLGGQPASFYHDAANLNAGSLPNASLSGVYSEPVNLSSPQNILRGNGAGITGIASASLATTATNALALNSQPSSFYQNASNFDAGTLPNARLQGAYSSLVTLSNTTLTGNGAGLTALRANMITGRVPSERLSGTYSRAVSFSNANNYFTAALSGFGLGLTGLNASQITTGTIPVARLEVPFWIIQNRTLMRRQLSSLSPSMYLDSTAWTTVDLSSQVVNLEFGGTAVLTWSMTAYANFAPGLFRIVPRIDGVVDDTKSMPFYFNLSGVHRTVSGTTTFPITAGQHTIDLAVRRSTQSPTTVMRMDANDKSSWSLIVMR